MDILYDVILLICNAWCFLDAKSFCMLNETTYSQLSPCGHLAITDTPLIRTAAKSPTKVIEV